MATITVSAYAADVGYAARDIRRIHAAGADGVHVDVMDGNFVPAIGLGPRWLGEMHRHIKLPVDVHLMTCAPLEFLGRFVILGVDTAILHLETAPPDEFHEAAAILSDRGIRLGAALSPQMPIHALNPVLHLLDDILIMSAEPGCDGARFLPNTPDRIAAVRSLAVRRPRILVDGGLDAVTALECIDHGADTVVMGRGFFAHGDPAALCEMIHEAIPPGW